MSGGRPGAAPSSPTTPTTTTSQAVGQGAYSLQDRILPTIQICIYMIYMQSSLNAVNGLLHFTI